MLARLAASFAFASVCAGGAVLAGTVFEHASGLPLAQAHVHVTLLTTRESADASTGPNGRFRLETRTQDDYEIDVVKPNYLRTVVLRTQSVTPGSLETEPLVVPLVRLSAITGRIVDEASRPLGKVRIDLFRKPDPDAPLQWTGTTESEPDGSYRLHSIAPGDYVVRASGAAFGPVRLFGDAERGGLNLTAIRSTAFRVTGRVVGPNTAGRATVVLVNSAEPGIMLGAALAEPGGAFRFDNVRPGSYDVLAIQGTSGAELESGNVRITITASNVEDIPLALRPGHRVVLTVKHTAQENSQPVCKGPLNVVLSPVLPWSSLRPSAGVLEDSGQVELGPLASVRYRLTAASGSWKDGETCVGRSPEFVDLTSAERNQERVEILMQPLGSIRGRLKGAEASHRYLVGLVPYGTHNVENASVMVQKPGPTSTFAFTNVPNGNYLLVSWHPSDLRAFSMTNDLVRAEAGAVVNVQIDAPATGAYR